MPHTPHPHSNPNPTTNPNPSTGTGRHAGPAAHPTTAQPRHADGLELPAVPLAVWSTPAPPTAPGTEWTVPPLLAQRLIAVYTQPGCTVLTTGGSARLIARTATRLDRRPARTSGRRPAPGTVDLILATPPHAADADGPADGGADQARRWARLLSPAGVLAVVLPPGRGPAEPTAVVAAAAGAGLGYLQHVVALLWTLHEDHLDPPTTGSAEVDGLSGAGQPAYADVLLFTALVLQPDFVILCRVGPGRGAATA